ncbi:MAG: hypothetical protein IT446_00845 [Phycisphaerales bacterium]|nr:hypothetical protein [Phycisphaerales bacterium]
MLRRWIEQHLNLHLPDQPVCPYHQSPMQYLIQSYFEPAGDLVVWAPRGGGKTRLGAAATLLDLFHKPGCSVRILGGSLEQSYKMWDHLLPDVQRLAADQLTTRGNARRFRLENGSEASVLTQSERAVRGVRVQKVRCDEVELFRPEVWEASQLVTRSRTPSDGEGGVEIRGVIEAFSTWHRVGGMMQRIIESARKQHTMIIKWCLLEVLQRCPPERSCDSCPLWDECRGIAKTRCDGFIGIDDAIRMKQRVSREVWEAEMLCKRPSRRNAVFAAFNADTHVRTQFPDITTSAETWLAMDFGFVNPFVCLWIVRHDDVTYVIDEYVQEQRTMQEHLEQVKAHPWGRVRRIACDPAGSGRNEQTAVSNVQMLRAAGYTVRFRKSRIVEGIEMIRAALRPAAGKPTLFVHPRCARLIEALRNYRYADPSSELPLKDGTHDHPIDALRYYFVNSRRSESPPRSY